MTRLTPPRPALPARGAALLLMLAAAGVSVPAGAQVSTWRVGDGGEEWAEQGLIAAGVDVSGPEALRPNGFTPDDNIVEAVTWQDAGTGPDDFVVEGQARVWARVADGQPNLAMVDGDPSTSTGARFQSPGEDQEGRIFIYDLGASFPAERIAFYPNPADSNAFIRAYQVEISDGRTFTSAERPVFELLTRVQSTNQVRAEIEFPRQLLRFFKITTLAANPFDIAEVEVYGEGFVPRAHHLSKYIDFGEPVVFGGVEVSAARVVPPEEEPQASVTLSFRNGADDTPVIYYRVDLETGSETEITEAEYNSLPERERTDRYDAANWSAWSSPLTMDSTGTYAVEADFLPAPRRFFQFDLRFSGTDTQVMQVGELAVTYSPAHAGAAWAEVAVAADPTPENDVAIATTGVATEFVYAVHVDFSSGGRGFDGLRIQTPSPPTFQSLRFGEAGAEVVPDSVREEDGALVVFFPSRRVTAASNEPLFVRFTATPLLYSTQFRGWLLDSGGSLPQQVAAGSASPQLGTNSLQVYGSLSRPLSRFEVSPAVVTPNGDGLNDAAAISYDIINLVEDAQVLLVAYDLAGRPLRRIHDGPRGAGSYTDRWDGRDDADQVVPPGHYIVKLSVQTQSATLEDLRVLAVAY